ncbi:MAG: hypothetical protein QOK19_2267 [Solirubrobacteraceae bacterium]|jgi:hypothetical protein|nr:hypothetical protein [Solirubrobacteraceae bacterium]
MIRGLIGRALDWRFRAVITRLDEVGERCRHLEELLEGRVEPMLRAVFDEEAENRRRLFALRSSSGYERPFLEEDPLVSVAIATRGQGEELIERALPSLLSQSHSNLEVIVVGDAAPAELGERLAAVDDDRVRFTNLTQRTAAHRDPAQHWLVGSTIPRNEAARLARGQWLVHFDDDDRMRPDAIAQLLCCAREQRAEVAYGGFEIHGPDGSLERALRFPPTFGSFGWQGALVHRGLRFFERELSAVSIPLPGDLYMLERMLRVGVRFAMLERIVWDYYPSSINSPESTRQTDSQISSATASGMSL